MTRSVRSQLYRAARDLGDLQAAVKGPVPLGKRYVRKAAYRHVNRQLADILRLIGLG